MTRAQVLQRLSASKADLGAGFGVTGLALCGSVARDLARDGSDVDVLVWLDGPATLERLFGGQFFLEDLLGRPIWSPTRGFARAEGTASSARPCVIQAPQYDIVLM